MMRWSTDYSVTGTGFEICASTECCETIMYHSPEALVGNSTDDEEQGYFTLAGVANNRSYYRMDVEVNYSIYVSFAEMAINGSDAWVITTEAPESSIFDSSEIYGYSLEPVRCVRMVSLWYIHGHAQTRMTTSCEEPPTPPTPAVPTMTPPTSAPVSCDNVEDTGFSIRNTCETCSCEQLAAVGGCVHDTYGVMISAICCAACEAAVTAMAPAPSTFTQIQTTIPQSVDPGSSAPSNPSWRPSSQPPTVTSGSSSSPSPMLPMPTASPSSSPSQNRTSAGQAAGSGDGGSSTGVIIGIVVAVVVIGAVIVAWFTVDRNKLRKNLGMRNKSFGQNPYSDEAPEPWSMENPAYQSSA